MIQIFQYIIFVILSIYAFTKSLSYAIYEIKEENNKQGGTFIIVFSLISFILLNVCLIIR